MAEELSIKYRVECLTCHAKFTVDSVKGHVPKHPPLGSRLNPDGSWWPCAGSNVVGSLVHPIYTEKTPEAP